MSFSIISENFFFFGWVSKISLFWQLGPKSAHPKKHYKNKGFQQPFSGTKHMRHETAIFGPKKTKFINSNYHLFCLFSSLSTTENTNNCWNPYLYSVLTNLKQENFQNLNLKHWKLKNPIFELLFEKKAIFRKLPDNWAQKKNTKW